MPYLEAEIRQIETGKMGNTFSNQGCSVCSSLPVDVGSS